MTIALLSASAARAQIPTPIVPQPTAEPAPPATDLEAERHATLGQRFLERGDGQRAVEEFRRAYEVKADPRYLYDIATAYDHAGLDAQARFYYERYLEAVPDAPDREDVEEHLATLGRQPPPPAPAPAASLPSFAHDLVVVPVADTPPPRPLWKRWWAWAAFGAVVVGSAVAIFALGHGGGNSPSTALGDKTFY